ncbi:hypothetical protein WJX72_007711 [[Myrmecia] bisecta]|uniref:Inositol polyphosphate multikinase n=1 Tax=[Myrmecia] bisecta TaxID=41462 RepID=A0AAW1PTF1_9CHLO
MATTDCQSTSGLRLRPCKHQVAGHLFEEGKAGSLVDDRGHFYKPLQMGPRGDREREFYEHIMSAVRNEQDELMDTEASHSGNLSDDGSEASVSGRTSEDDEEHRQQHLPFSVRNAVLLRSIPRFYRTVELDGRKLLELEDVARRYRHPSIIDIKVGFRTWYPTADTRYIEKCKVKDHMTTQAALGFKICGMQVYRSCQRAYWRASKRWCKQLPQEAVNKALVRFANNEAGLRPEDVYGGERGAIAQLRQLEAWFQKQREMCFYSSSVLVIYEGDAETAEEANVTIRLVDFAHTFAAEGHKDSNFIAGTRALIKALTGVMKLDYHDCIL